MYIVYLPPGKNTRKATAACAAVACIALFSGAALLIPLEDGGQILAGVAAFDLCHFLRGAAGYHGSAAVAALGPQVDEVVRSLDHVQVVLNDQHAVAGVHQTLQHAHQPIHVRHMVLPVPRRLSSVASLMRWASPPESWVLGWPSLM